LEAFARLVRFGNVPPFHVEAFGSCGDDLRQAVEGRGLASLIRVYEAVDFTSRFDLFVVPSRAGARAAMQALCAGVPLVGAGGVGLREIVEGTPARVCSADVASLEVALREALSDPRTEEAHDYALTARDRFDARRAAGRLVELYDRLTAEVGAVRAA
jgi:glycosyltransferase involved in cell wall biosynthesis